MMKAIPRSSRKRLALLAVAAMGALATGFATSGPAHAVGGCSPRCVILIEVNGLQPQDVTPQTTPFLWALAHPSSSTYGSVPLSGRAGWMWQAARGVTASSNAAATEALLTGGFPEENGIPADTYIDRSAGTGSHQLYQLGADPNCQGGAGVPCGNLAASSVADTIIHDTGPNGGSTLGVATFIGDPALATIVNGQNGGPQNGAVQAGDADHSWYPASSNDGDPRLCPPTDATAAAASGATQAPPTPVCPADDLQTMNTATQFLDPGPNITLTYIYLAELGIAKQYNGVVNANSTAYAPGAASGSGATGPVGPSGSPPPSVGQALSDLDFSIAQFVAQYNSQRGGDWSNTVMMIVGNHGYELTPQNQRVPDPYSDPANSPSTASSAGGNPDPNVPYGDSTPDLSEYVTGLANSITKTTDSAMLIPQGSMATVYYNPTNKTALNDPTLRANVLAALRADLLGTGKDAAGVPQVNGDSRCQQSSAGGCVSEVLYVNPTDAPAGHPELAIANKHPSWRQDTVNLKSCDQNAPFVSPLPITVGTTTYARCQSTGSAGELLVVMSPGWAAGRIAPLVGTQGNPPAATQPIPGINYSDPVNPYLASGGGPRNRAIAAIIDGPTANNVTREFKWSPTANPPNDGRSPVINGPDLPNSDPNTESANGQAKYSGATAYDQANGYQADTSAATDFANAIPGDDAVIAGASVDYSDPAHPRYPLQGPVVEGHEKQAQTVDFMPTIAALLKVSVPSNQLAGRMLQEAFGILLQPVNNSEDIGAQLPDPCTVDPASCQPPPPVVYPPPPVNPFSFTGLIRNVRAQVVDDRYQPARMAPLGADLSYLELTADFGKPEAQVTLTLYHTGSKPPAAGTSSTSARSGRSHASHKAHGARTHHTSSRAHRAPANTPQSAGLNLVALVRFCPFTVKRGPDVKLRFKVPPKFQPDHVGITVQEVVPTTPSAASGAPAGSACGSPSQLAFRPVGPIAGTIVPIKDASLLHTKAHEGAAARGTSRVKRSSSRSRPRSKAHGH